VNGNIFNSKGVHVGVVTGHAVFSLKGEKLYDLRVCPERLCGVA
jgi:hypothetical protein